jgi:NADPH2:quinone reductase
MKALLCKAFGPVRDLVIEEVPDPQAGPGEVVVDIVAAGLNFPDKLMVNGQYQVKNELPFIPGAEAAGIVRETGNEVRHLNVGDRVIVLPMSGAFAEQCAVPADQVIPLPDSLSFEQGAGFTVAYGTSFHALKPCAQLQADETVLVLGAAGGVGTAAVEIAKAMGAKVIAAASTEQKLEFAREVGADETINYSEVPLRDAVKELTGGKGVDIVYDPVGGDLAIQALRSLAWHGRYLVVGFASGKIPELPANLALLKEASISGVWWGTWASRTPEESHTNMSELFSLVAEGKLTPRVTASYALEDFVEAFAAISDRKARAKVVFSLNATLLSKHQAC